MELKFDKDPYFAKDPIRHSHFIYLTNMTKNKWTSGKEIGLCNFEVS